MTHEQKRTVAWELLNAAGTLAEFWDAERTGVPGEDARACLARWLKHLPGDEWDVRLGEVEGA